MRCKERNAWFMFTDVSPYKALGPGADLWILPWDPMGFWFKKINWRLGFQIIAPVPQTDISISRPILLSTEEVFPNKRILCLPEKREGWPSACYGYWKDLGCPSLRIFLPLGVEKDSLSANWPERESHHIFSCVSADKRSLQP